MVNCLEGISSVFADVVELVVKVGWMVQTRTICASLTTRRTIPLVPLLFSLQCEKLDENENPVYVPYPSFILSLLFFSVPIYHRLFYQGKRNRLAILHVVLLNYNSHGICAEFTIQPSLLSQWKESGVESFSTNKRKSCEPLFTRRKHLPLLFLQ